MAGQCLGWKRRCRWSAPADPEGPGVLPPFFFSKSCSFQAILSKFWARGSAAPSRPKSCIRPGPKFSNGPVCNFVWNTVPVSFLAKKYYFEFQDYKWIRELQKGRCLSFVTDLFSSTQINSLPLSLLQTASHILHVVLRPDMRDNCSLLGVWFTKSCMATVACKMRVETQYRWVPLYPNMFKLK